MARPVTVLTGALGAGKTTLLNAALKSGAIRNAAVIVNEFGSVGIDNELIEASSEDVVLLPGGCVCCQVRADLAEALMRLERGASRAEIPAFERIVVETSGLAEPGPILQLFAESPALTGRYRLESLVTVVDALFGGAALAEAGTAYRQALLADRILVTKWEDVPAGVLEALEARLGEVNPHAGRALAERGSADAEWFGPAPFPAPRTVPAEALRAAHDEAVTSFVLHWDAPQPLAAIGGWLQGLADNYGARLLRVKGIVAVEEDPHAVAVHAIQHLVAPPEFLSIPGGASRVVFITRGLEPGDVRPAWPSAAGAAQPQLPPQAAPRPPLQRPTGVFSGAAVRR
jgi:G3E family GTPase